MVADYCVEKSKNETQNMFLSHYRNFNQPRLTYCCIITRPNCALGRRTILCLGVPGFRKFAYFWSDFERYSVLSICLWNPKQQRKEEMLRIPRQIYFWPVAESAYNAQNAQFGLVMIGLLQLLFVPFSKFYLQINIV